MYGEAYASSHLPSTIARPPHTVRRGKWLAARAAALERPIVSLGGAVLALSLPLVFLHVDYQPGFALGAGSTDVSVYLSDLAVLAVGLAALLAGVRWGFRPLREGLSIWVAGVALVLMVFVATAYPLLSDRSYDWHRHLVTAGKFAEYAVLAPALPLLLRRRRERWVLLSAVVAWSAVATTVGVAQFFGWDVAQAWAPGRRQPSFLGHHDFAALSCASAAIGLAALAVPAWRVNRGLAALGVAAGAVGLIVSGSVAAAAGFGAAALAVALVAWRRGALSPSRLVAVALVAAAVGGGIAVLRGGDLDQFVRFLGARRATPSTEQNVQTYAQHTLLAYIGVKIFLQHPAVGVGWQGSSEESGFGPHLAAAHRRFPGSPPLSFPSREHPWGVQNAWVQALADLGVVGFVLFAGLFATGLVVAARRALRSPPELAGPALVAGAWLLCAMGTWSAVGLVAGIPLDALTWLGLGLAATAAAGAARAVA
jgi:O-antigen ligase